MPGVWNLTSPADLLRKPEVDLARMKAAPRDARPAFDFFVTAFHISDWLQPHDGAKRRTMIAGSPLLIIAGAIANGSKHFNTDDPRWKGVQGTYSGMRGPLGATPAGIPTDLWVALGKDLAEAAQCPEDISAIGLAGRILDWWRGNL